MHIILDERDSTFLPIVRSGVEAVDIDSIIGRPVIIEKTPSGGYTMKIYRDDFIGASARLIEYYRGNGKPDSETRTLIDELLNLIFSSPFTARKDTR